jgi:hypothetical protein
MTVRSRLVRVHPLIWIASGAAVAALIAWPLGGWDTVALQTKIVPVVEPGEIVTGQQYALSVDGLELTDINPDGYTEPEVGETFLIAHVTVEIQSDTAANAGSIGSASNSPLAVGTVAGFGTDVRGDVRLASDGTISPNLQPGLPAELIVVWTVPTASIEAGDEVDVRIIDRTLTENFLTLGTTWSRPRPIAETTVTVES